MTAAMGENIGSNIVKAAGIVLLMNILSRFLGFVRDATIAREFGATGATDAYLVAYTLPYALQAVLGMAFISVIVPIITGYLVKDEKLEVFNVTAIIFNWTVLILSVITVVGIIMAPWLIKLLAPGFTGETYNLTVVLTRIIFPSIIFMGAGMLLTGVLNANGVFGVPAFAPALANMVVIFVVLVFAGQFQVYGLAVGTVLAFICFFALQLPFMRKLGYRWQWKWDRHHPAVKRAGATLFPVTLSIAINQIYLAINRIFASGLEPGSITALDFAYRLMALPLGIFVAAIATAIFPAFSRYVARSDGAGLAKSLGTGLALVSLIALPSAIGLMVIREPLIQAVFERGAFDAYATKRTAIALWYFSIGLWAVGANTIVTRAYYAMDNIRIPLGLGLLCALINVLLSFVLMPVLSHGGLALANSLSAITNIILLLVVLKVYLPEMDMRKMLGAFGKALTASILMGVAVSVLLGYLKVWMGTGFVALVLQIILPAVIGALIYLLLLKIFRVKELVLVKDMVFKKK